MTIKEIARLAGVSISTVSKVINKKDEQITPETRERVLRIVKEYHYTPYGDVLAAQSNRKFLLGVMYDIDGGNDRIIPGLVKEAGKRGYSTIVTTSATAEDEYRNFQVLRSHQVDGIFWNPVKRFNPEQDRMIKESGLPYLMMDFRRPCDPDNVCFDHWEIGYHLTEMLLEKHHRKILCLLEIHGMRADMMFQGYRQCLFDHGIPFQDSYLHSWPSPETTDPIDLTEFTAVICFNLRLARKVFNLAERMGISIPLDLSVVAIGTGEKGETQEDVSALGKPFVQITKFAVERLVSQIEGRPLEQERFAMAFDFNHTKSISVPGNIRNRRILVMGTAAMETVIDLEADSRVDLMRAAGHREIPGGSGVKQALTAARLGADCYLIGHVGNDSEGRRLYTHLKEKNINVDGLILENEGETGQIYTIHNVQSTKRISYNGSSRQMTVPELEDKKTLFRYCRFCLLQGDMDKRLLACAAALARGQKAKTILKVADLNQLDEDLARCGDLLVIADGVKDCLTEAQMRELCRKGPSVAVSIGRDGCRWLAGQRLYTLPVDIPTGPEGEDAADGFTAALACYLTDGVRPEEAVGQAARLLYQAGSEEKRI